MAEDYKVIRPEDCQSEVGRSYQDLVELWTQWFVSADPDLNNNGNVVFLRGIDFPRSPQMTGYSRRPAVMVGNHSLNILSKQFLFIPVITTTANEIDDNAKTPQERSYIVWRDTNEGDNPPSRNQVIIDGNSLDTVPFLTFSRDFRLDVPDVPYGRSLKDYFDIPITTTGDVQAQTGGYFVLIRFTNDKEFKNHSIIFQAQGIQGLEGPYFASGIYSVNVSPSALHSEDFVDERRKANPAIVQRLLLELSYKIDKNEMSEDECEKLRTVVSSL